MLFICTNGRALRMNGQEIGTAISNGMINGMLQGLMILVKSPAFWAFAIFCVIVAILKNKINRKG